MAKKRRKKETGKREMQKGKERKNMNLFSSLIGLFDF